MCGRYAFYQRPSEVRRQLEEAHMPVDECPGDDECRQTYNLPPGSFGVVYRADVPDHGAGPRTKPSKKSADDEDDEHVDGAAVEYEATSSSQQPKEIHYKLQSMKWGLIPFWVKRSPDYSSMMRTINCRDDSLFDSRGIWNNPKRRKRCIVICQGFYEWLKKNNGKDRLPHYIKRKDGQLMCFAGLWDCAKYEGSEEKHYTFTIITTDSNKQLNFLHDRMPVIFEPGSEAIRTWLDPGRYEWTDELQKMLKPFEGELEVFQVNKDVGKVGNDSPSFIIPIDKSNTGIVNFFNNQKKLAKTTVTKASIVKAEEDVKVNGVGTEKKSEETRKTTQNETTESNAPLPAPPRGIKRDHSDGEGKLQSSPRKKTAQSSQGSMQKKSLPAQPSPAKPSPAKSAKKTRSSITNGSSSMSSTSAKSAAQGTPKITKFFGK